jgi:phage shock protein A
MFERLGKLIKGFFSIFIGNLEQANPRALLEAEITSFHEAVGEYNKNLAKQAALVEKLRTAIDRDKRELDKLKGRTQSLVNAKQMEEAGRVALQMKNLSQQVTDNEAGFKQADDLYRNLTKQRDVYMRDAQRRIDTIKQKMSQAEIAESQAKLAEIATSTSFNMAGTGATLERLEERLDDRVAQATGKARVAADSVAGGTWTHKAEEESAMEAQALAEFTSLMGGAAPEAPKEAAPAAAAPRELGT